MAVVSLLHLGCALMQPNGTTGAFTRDGDGHLTTQPTISEIELQEDLERFTTVFMSRLLQAREELTATLPPRAQSTLARKTLAYAWNAMEIATGPDPPTNLLDMAVFIDLSSQLIEEQWIPQVYGPRGHVLLVTFRKAERDLQPILDKVTTPGQRAVLDSLAREWRLRNPELTFVEGVRLLDFAAEAAEGQPAADGGANGLLANVRAATVAAEEGLLLGERALYLGQRLPFLLRLQIRPAVDELALALAPYGEAVDTMLDGVSSIEPVVEETMRLVEVSSDMLGRTRALAAQIEALIPLIRELDIPPIDHEYLARADSLAETALALVRELGDANGTADGLVPETVTRIEGIVLRIAVYLMLVGAVWALCWWAGYYIVKTRGQRRHSSSSPHW